MKINNTLKVGTIILFSLALVACGKHKSPSPVTPVTPDTPVTPVIPIPAALKGTWAYKCVAETDTDNPSSFVKEKQTYNGSTVIMSDTSYSDPACQQPLVNITMTGTFKLGEIVNKGSQDEHTKIDRTSKTVVVTIQNPETVGLANAGELPSLEFGITDWKLNEPKDLTQNKLARKYYDVGDTDLNIFKIHTNKLFEGDLGGDLDPTGRPTTLNKVGAARVTNNQTQTTSHESK
ncbi:MAG: hypothetical protein KAH18_04660 [Psychromonas sp.]|nr:hypothetical protein [Psychromonas sp.]